jgi:fructokinase
LTSLFARPKSLHIVSFRIVGIGELLWDLLPTGRKLGGAPANFSYHAHALGADAHLISRVGHDSDGRTAFAQLESLGLSTDCIQIDPALPTGTVTVQLERDGQPRYTIHENVAWDALAADTPARAAISDAQAVCFGTLAQRCECARQTIRVLLSLAPSSALRILDVNLRAPYLSRDVIIDSLRLANVLKLNETELPLIGQFLEISGEPGEIIPILAERFALSCVAYTRGASGSVLFAKGQWSELPSPPTQVVDTVGAGDSFTAAMALGLLAKWPLREIHARSTELAAFVCSQAGATPPLPERMKVPFLRTPANSPC